MFERYSSCCCFLVYIDEVVRSLVYEPCLDIEESANHEQPKKKAKRENARRWKKTFSADKRSQSSITHWVKVFLLQYVENDYRQ